MEPSAIKRFSEVIDRNSDSNSLCSEATDKEDLFDQPNKRLKLSHTNTIIRNLVIDKLLEECTNQKLEIVTVTKKLLLQQFTKIVALHESGASYNMEKFQAVTFVKTLLSQELVSGVQFSQMLSPTKTDTLPLDLLWYLSQLQVISLEQVISRFTENKRNRSQMLDDALALILKKLQDDNAEIILKNFYVLLIALSYDLKREYEPLQRVSSEMLLELLHKFLEIIPNINDDSSDNEKKNENCINIFDLLINDKTVTPESLKEFLSNQLISILTFKPEVRLTFAIQQQSTWRSTNSNKILTAVLFSIIKGLGHEEAFIIMDKVVSSLEVNWGYILTFLSTLLLAHHESAAKLKDVIDSYFRKGCSAHATEYLILAFLFARHASMEGRHVFPSYPHWFGATFGSESSSPANNKQSFVVLTRMRRVMMPPEVIYNLSKYEMLVTSRAWKFPVLLNIFKFRFLTDLVPYESVHILRTHIHQSVFVPKGCQNILRDYQRLSQVRLEELNENGTEPCIGSRNSSSLSEFQQNKVDSEIKSAISHYEEFGKVPSFILEASIFKRPYYLSSFLPSLLTRRHLPDTPDTRMKLVEDLFLLGKIPEKMYKSYTDDCKKIAPHFAPLPVEGKMDSNTKESPYEALDEYLKKLVDIKMQCVYEEASTESLRILSQLTNCIEKLMAKTDSGQDTTLIIHCVEQDSQIVTNQIVAKIFKAIGRLLSCDFNSIRERIGQLVTLLATSPSLQSAMMISLFQHFSALQETKEAKAEKFQFVGVFICELKYRDDLFLPMKLSTTAEKKFLTPAELFLKNLPLDNTRNIYSSCCVLSAVLEANLEIGSISEKHADKSKMMDVHHLYRCVAARLCVMSLEEVDGVSYYPVLQPYVCQLPFILESKIPLCCRFLVEKFQELEEVPYDMWINFELEIPWGRTPLDIRMRYLHFCFLSHCGRCKKDFSIQASVDEGFLILFWSLVNAGIKKENAADLFILLQSLSFNDSDSLSLLEEWLKWKKNFTSHSDNEASSNLILYHAKLVVFLRLCYALPPPLFIGRRPSLVTLTPFTKIIHDILEMEGDLFLDVQETRFFFECFLDVCQRLSPPSVHVQRCFVFLNSSVLLHYIVVKDILKRYSSVIEKYPCLQYLKFWTEWKAISSSLRSLTTRSFAIFASSLLNRGEMVNFDQHNLSEQAPTTVYIFSSAVLGLQLMQRSNRSGDPDEESLWSPVTETDATQMMTDVSSLLDSVVRGAWSDPVRRMTAWKEEAASIPSFPFPVFWRAFLVGLVHALLTLLDKQSAQKEEKEESDKKGDIFPRLISLLLLSFTALAKFYERSPDSPPSSFSYLSSLSCRIYFFIDKMSDENKREIPDSVLRVCDKEFVAAIGLRESKHMLNYLERCDPIPTP